MSIELNSLKPLEKLVEAIKNYNLVVDQFLDSGGKMDIKVGGDGYLYDLDVTIRIGDFMVDQVLEKALEAQINAA